MLMVKRTASPSSDAFSDHGRSGRVSGRQDGDELLAADACAEITGAQFAAHCLRERHQYVVADGMAVAIIDALEVIEVEREHRQRFRRAPGQGDVGIEAGQAHAPVGETGQHVVGGVAARLQQPLQQCQLRGAGPGRDDHDQAQQPQAGQRR